MTEGARTRLIAWAHELRNPTQDHSMMSHLISGLETAVDRDEERALLRVLATLDLHEDVDAVLGPP